MSDMTEREAAFIVDVMQQDAEMRGLTSLADPTAAAPAGRALDGDALNEALAVLLGWQKWPEKRGNQWTDGVDFTTYWMVPPWSTDSRAALGPWGHALCDAMRARGWTLMLHSPTGGMQIKAPWMAEWYRSEDEYTGARRRGATAAEAIARAAHAALTAEAGG